MIRGTERRGFEMEYRAFTEGVRPGSVTTSHEVMVLICYLMDKAGQPVSFKELNSALQSQELVNYFQFAEAMESLRKSGHILPQEYQGESCFALTDLGRQASRAFEEDLPLAVRERGTRAMDRILTLVRRQKENKVEIRQVEDGWQLTLTITDIGSDLMSVTIFMPTQDACEKIRRRFLNDPMLTYKGVFALLTGDTETVGELVSSQEDLFQD